MAMNILQRLGSLFGLRSMENPRRPLDPWQQATGDSLTGSMSASGVRVTADKAMTSAPFWRGVSLISSTVAKLPLGVYRKVAPGVELDPSHPAHRLLRREPNEAMTPSAWKASRIARAVVFGNAYDYVVRKASGEPVELWPLDSERTHPERVGGQLWYVHELKGGEKRKLAPEDVLHLKGPSMDGLEGMGALGRAREALGLDLGTRAFASGFFRNNARPNVLLKHPGRLSPEARKVMRESWERMHSGLDNAHRTAILEEGMEAIELSINAEESQLLESRQFSLVEIANFLGLPPHKLGAATNVSYSSLEQENQAFLDDCIDGWLVKDEEEYEAKLLSPYQRTRDTHCISYDRFPLVRADLAQRGAYYVQAINGGWMSPDEARAREGMNPLPGGAGKVWFRPLNLAPIGVDPDGPEGGAVGSATSLLDVPDVRQDGDYDCGPAAVASVCRFFGLGAGSPADLVEALQTTARKGTKPDAILAYLSRLGLVVTASGQLETVDLARLFAAGQPVLCPIRSESGGHWVVVIGTGLGLVFVQDPAAGRRMIAEQEWLDGWTDRDSDGVTYERYGVAVGRELLDQAAKGANNDGNEESVNPDGGDQK